MTISGNTFLGPRRRPDGEIEKRKLDQDTLPVFLTLPLQGPAEKIDQMYRFSRQLLAANRLDLILEMTARAAVEILQMKYCRILMPDTGGGWQCRAAFPVGDEHARVGDQETLLALPIYTQAAASPHLTVLRRGSALWTALERSFPRSSRPGCVALIPIRLDDEVLGLLVIGQRPKGSQDCLAEDNRLVAQYLADQAGGAISRIRTSARLFENQAQTVQALSKAIEVRDDPTGGHSSNMTRLAERLAAACRCSEAEIQTIRWAGMLHDIGKIGIPDSILHRPGPLNEQEWVVIRRHPDLGAEIVLMASHLARVAELIRSHHEHFDGSGYPRCLQGEQIPLGARILAVVDAYTAMTDGRAYRSSISHADALAELRRCAGAHFDPQVIEVFTSLFL